jgi:hypothetical protein
MAARRGSWLRAAAHGCAPRLMAARRGSWLFDQDGAGIEQVEALALHVLLGLGPGLRDDNRDVAAGGCGVGEPG